MLTTSTELPAAEVAKAYKSLWRVERAFRTLKSTLDVRPIFHQRDDSVIGHITGCFLALRLEVDLQRRLDAKGLAAPWPDLMRDLARLQAVIVDLDGTRYRLRTDCAWPRRHRLPGRRRRDPDRGHRARPHPRPRDHRPNRPRRRSPPCSDKNSVHRLTA